MIESYENIIQIVVLVVCVTVAGSRALAYRSRTWTLLAFSFGSMLLGDLFWLACLIFYGDTPQISAVSDLSWYAAYLFFYLLLRQVTPQVSGREKSLFPLLAPAFTLAMAAFYSQWGGVLNNIIYALLMGLLMGAVLRRFRGVGNRPYRSLLTVTLVFCLLEYCLWTASCFWDGDTLKNPYYWCDFLVTVSYLFFLPATKKAVAA